MRKHILVNIKGNGEEYLASRYGTAKSARIKNISLMTRARKDNETHHGDDHSFYSICSIDGPKIALAVYVENGGGGDLLGLLL